ncbi:transglycosylase SLT domain-containing protein [Kumtagia ephedrae]|uniref:Lytic transglycosylase n=1 Tax=Kumtagia ephedrae TaxID=2116701 RepID=A0A2P7SLI6_9HYPH|nr:transglycosylase SLT domain-containing protein [Mesorhizobium ephedrae]PSJ63346.1 lytic transglycosylase [Mesorhizobium ephedrae]
MERSVPARLAASLRPILAAAAVFTSSACLPAAAAPANACEPEILRAADRYGVPVGILYAVGLTETGNKGSLQPNALNIEGKAVFPGSREQAVAAVEEARRGGAKLIDLGCMQINHHYHSQHFAGTRDMLDPRKNVDYAARFLVSLHARHRTWSMAVARYHAGPDNDPAQKRYVCRVIANMVATGFGKWTPNARTFCN